MAFLFRPACKAAIVLDDAEQRPLIDVRTARVPVDSGLPAHTERLPLFVGAEPVSGIVQLSVDRDKRVEHSGLKIELVGRVELTYDRSNQSDFMSLVQELAPAGVSTESTTYRFEFPNFDKPYESYNGLNVRLRYFLRFTLQRSLLPDMVEENEVWVQVHQTAPEINSSIKMEVGIEEALHIEFEFSKSKFHLRDVIVGKIYFLLVRIRIKHMELGLIRRESTGAGANTYTETEALSKYEIMDGDPVKAESIPVRMFLGAFDLSPTYRSIHGHFSTRYYLNLVLVDEEDRRYFKQQEITLWRKAPKRSKAKFAQTSHQNGDASN